MRLFNFRNYLYRRKIRNDRIFYRKMVLRFGEFIFHCIELPLMVALVESGLYLIGLTKIPFSFGKC